MAQTRTNFKAGVTASIFTNIYKLIKGNTVRDKFLVMADSVVFPEDIALTELVSGGAVSIGTYGGSGTNNDIRVAAASWYIQGQGTFSTSGNTDFDDIALSSAGNQRYVGLYGNTSNTVIKVEGAEAALATFPATPVNTALIGYVLVGDANVATTPDLSGYLLKASKATAAEIITGTDDTKWISPLQLKTAGHIPRVTSIASSATPTANWDTTDQFNVLALSANTVFAVPTGTPLDGQVLWYRYKDNGTPWTIGFNAVFRFIGVIAPSTTVASKTGYFAGKWNAADSKIDVLATGIEA